MRDWFITSPRLTLHGKKHSTGLKDAAITVWLEKDVLYPEAQFRADVRIIEGGPKRDHNHVRKRANITTVYVGDSK